MRIKTVETRIDSALLVLSLGIHILWYFIPTLVRNQYIMPLIDKRQPKHRAPETGRHRPAPGRHGISAAFVAEFKGITSTLQHHAA